MTSNEIRMKLGLRPSKAENAEELRNPNLNRSDNDPNNNSVNFDNLTKSLTGKETIDG